MYSASVIGAIIAGVAGFSSLVFACEDIFPFISLKKKRQPSSYDVKSNTDDIKSNTDDIKSNTDDVKSNTDDANHNICDGDWEFVENEF